MRGVPTDHRTTETPSPKKIVPIRCYQHPIGTNHNLNCIGVKSMTIDHFTAFLGKNVHFAIKCNAIPIFDELFYFVSGEVQAVLIHKNFADCEFLVDDEFYRFSDVKFVQDLPNPLNLS